jgi:hypothetical protein
MSWSKPKIIFTFLWVLLCSATLWWFMNHPKVWINPEITVLYIFIMLAITFPIGIVYWTILSMLAIVIPDPSLGREVELVLVWGGFVVVGYLQWCILVPWCYRNLRKFIKQRRKVGQT